MLRITAVPPLDRPSRLKRPLTISGAIQSDHRRPRQPYGAPRRPHRAPWGKLKTAQEALRLPSRQGQVVPRAQAASGGPQAAPRGPPEKRTPYHGRVALGGGGARGQRSYIA
eukprot:4759411-Pyramimonas_sp.AAC.1